MCRYLYMYMFIYKCVVSLFVLKTSREKHNRFYSKYLCMQRKLYRCIIVLYYIFIYYVYRINTQDTNFIQLSSRRAINACLIQFVLFIISVRKAHNTIHLSEYIYNILYYIFSYR